ncbi:Cholesterol oxidase [Thermoflexales bacterium]|nr:Cholesterol oxidase [Thermoflexales bacterium]
MRLSSPIEDLRPHYTVVVIGSGYGGGIAASRLARAGQQVCVLERGKEFLPGEYPDTELEALSEVQVRLPDQVLGSRTGLYDIRMNADMSVLVGCGLGGTSLINANVASRPERRLFDDPIWPQALRDDVDTVLAQCFDRAEEMLGSQPYPADLPPTPKMLAHEKSNNALQGKFYRLPLNVTFTAGVNKAGVHQPACTLCGDCMSGCNHGAKNTVIMNYLPDAKRHGAEIFTLVEVRHLERQGNRWLVHYQPLATGLEGFDAPTSCVSADIVILAAGTLGTNEILLRSKAAGLPLSDRLGERYSGNGDVLGFAYNNDLEINMLGFGPRPVKDTAPVGPTITTAIDLREQPNLDDGMIIEEGGVCAPLAALLPKTLSLAAKLVGRDTDESLTDAIAEKTRELNSLIRGAYHGAIRNTQIYLVMTHDNSGGRLALHNDRVVITWPDSGAQPFVKNVNEKLLQATKPLGGTFVENPIWSKLQPNNMVAAHPLGGCSLAEDAQRGVTNHQGQVFSGVTGTAVYDNLIVNDGALLPRSIGTNPHITISALAERNMLRLAQERGWTIDYSWQPVDEPIVLGATTAKPGLQFSEAMEGYFSTKVKDDYAVAARQGQADGSSFRLIATIISDDIELMLSEPDHAAKLIGTVKAPALAPEPLTLFNGEFYLFSKDPQQFKVRYMRYVGTLTAKDGATYYFEGHKTVHNDPGFDVWSDTTTLFITLYAGKDDRGAVVGKGIIEIHLKDLRHQLTTMKVLNAQNLGQRLSILARFGRFFSGEIFDIYGGVFARPNVFNPAAPPRKKRALRTAAPEVHYFHTADNVRLRLTRYQGGKKGPVILAHGLGVSSLAFSTDLIETNMTEYLFAHGYDVWLLDYRSSIELPFAATPYTADDVAVYDWPAAVKTVLTLTGTSSVQAVVHCYGAITFNMAMCAGLQGVRSAVCSQVGSHLSVIPLNRIKAGLHLDAFIGKLGVKSLTMYTDADDHWLDKLYNGALNLYPHEYEEHCKSPVCHRITFLYAPLYEHDQLNTATHDNLHELFGVASISNFEHLGVMSRAGHIVNHKGEEVYLPHIDRMKIPIAFVQGEENQTWLPKSTEDTFNLLCQTNGPDLYSRYLIPHYGHIDCIFGQNAHKDVYPVILKHLENTQ